MDLTIISLVIAVVGIVLQLADAFPEHRETRKVIVLLSLGIFIGVAISATLGATYNITGNVERRFALLFGLVGMGGMFGLVAVFSDDENRQQAAATMALGATVIFLVVGLFVALGSVDRDPVYSTDEILLLANSAEKSGQYQTAIDRLEELQQRLDSTEARNAVGARIDKLQAAQAGAAN